MNTALLLIDIQNDYFENGTQPLVKSLQAAENAELILNKFRADNLPVIHVQHIATRPTATFFLPDTYGVQIHEKVKPLNIEKVIVKHSPNSFINTELYEYLKSLEVENLIICGMMTHMCIDATVRAAKDLGFNCTLINDACATKDLEIDGATVSAEFVQKSFLAALSYYYATVICATAFNQTSK